MWWVDSALLILHDFKGKFFQIVILNIHNWPQCIKIKQFKIVKTKIKLEAKLIKIIN